MEANRKHSAEKDDGIEKPGKTRKTAKDRTKSRRRRKKQVEGKAKREKEKRVAGRAGGKGRDGDEETLSEEEGRSIKIEKCESFSLRSVLERERNERLRCFLAKSMRPCRENALRKHVETGVESLSKITPDLHCSSRSHCVITEHVQI